MASDVAGGADERRRVLVLAGAAPGLGAALARTFANAGYRVVGLSRTAETGRLVEAELGEARAAYHHVLCDLTDPPAVEEALRAIERDVGAPSVAVYAPMKLVVKPFLELTPQEFEEVWRVTCHGAMIFASAVLPGFLAAGGGTLVFTGATAAVKGGARWATLASAKFALRGLAQSLARELSPRGVHVAHVVLDGLVWSPQTRRRFDPERSACLEPDAVAETYLSLARQHRSAWTHEIDLRPFGERF